VGDLEAALRLAGEALAHAAWSIEDGETLITLAYVETPGEREIVRYEAPSIPESIDWAHEDLAEKLMHGGQAAIVADGFATGGDGRRMDALVIELLGSNAEVLGHVVQPYRPKSKSALPILRRGSTFALVGEVILSDEVNAAHGESLIADGMRQHQEGNRLLRGRIEIPAPE
jgi:hypothetical protein